MHISVPKPSGRLRIRRGEYKIPGGKLVAVQVYDIDDALQRVVLDGDFFIDGVDNPNAVVQLIERTLCVASGQAAMDAVHRAYPTAQCVGLSAEALDKALARARGENIPSAAPRGEAQHKDSIDALSFTWNNLHLTVLDDDQPHTPAMHMALDELLARQVAQGQREPTLRFWQWAGNAVIIGLHQSLSNEVDEQRAKDLDFSVVRRITGGGAMFVEPGNTITYSLYVPADFLSGVSGYEAYKRCDEWALLALNNLGIQAQYKPINDITSPAGKIGGAAQRLFRSHTVDGPGCVLHHVTMAYDIDAARMMDVLRISREKISDKAVKSAAKRVDPLKSQTDLNRDDLCAALQHQALSIIPHTKHGALDEQTIQEAEQLAHEKFESFAWTHAIA
ncbi:biotin/lipoate A/B protein ligase family protein [Alloscardovia omnicolens]|uniref:lipoate--protein ligase family protein n=1 Tax=Alloscardovia omnicolens TaxID=419015 RepID=UPI003A6BB5E6